MLDPLLPEYDFLVIGAGPAGLLAALTLAGNPEPGKSRIRRIALIDKRDPWREPVSCAEAVSREGLESLVPRVESEWVRGPIDGVIFIAPDGTRVEFGKKGSGLLIDRALMHKRLAEECRARGVHCNFRMRAIGLSRLENGWRTLRCEGEKEIRARAVIDCSGPGLGLGQGEKITRGDFDLEPALFALVQGLDYPVNYIQLFFGRNYAPGGYAWLFPRDPRIANVGLVVGRDYAAEAPARQAMKKFLETTYPGAQVATWQGGAIPCGFPDDPLAVDNLYKAGDAANMVNPVSRAGILEAMAGGKFAAEAALKTAEMDNEEDRLPVYGEYKARWEKAYGLSHRRIARAKKAFMEIPDETFNRAAHALAKLPPGKRTLPRIFLAVLWRSPSLLWRMRGLFLPKLAMLAMLCAVLVTPSSAERGIELPRGVANQSLSIGCFQGVDEGVQAVDLTSGRRLWNAPGPSLPVAATDGECILLESDRIVAHEAKSGRVVARSGSVLPPGVRVTGRYEARSSQVFSFRARIEERLLDLAWSAQETRVYGMRMPDVRETGSGTLRFRIDSGTVEPGTAWVDRLPKVENSIRQKAGALGQVTNLNPVFFGASHAVLVLVRADGEVWMHRWDILTGKEMRRITLPLRPRGTGIVMAWGSLDGRHVAVSWQLPGPGQLDWDVFATDGSRAGRVNPHPFLSQFIVAGKRLILLEEIRKSGKSSRASVHAYDLGGREIWTLPVWTVPEFPPVP